MKSFRAQKAFRTFLRRLRERMRAVLSKEGEVVGDGGGGDGRAMLVATAMLGVASEGSKKELREWGDR